MFVRFRQTVRRLQVSLVETRRADGRVRHEHIAGLGSIAVPPTGADRIQFWSGCTRRVCQIALGPPSTARSWPRSRIPMPTLDERRTLQIEGAEADERFWSGLKEAQEEQSAGNQALAAKAEHNAKRAHEEAEKAAANAQTARDRIARQKRGEDVAVGAGTQLSRKQMIALTGGPAAVRCALHEAGAENELVEEMSKQGERGRAAVINAVYRRRVLSASEEPGLASGFSFRGL
jgi:hypothetical protein